RLCVLGMWTTNPNCERYSMSAGRLHTCADRYTGEVLCWGQGHFLGHGGSLLEQPSPVFVANLSDAAEVASGFSHTCALRRTGEIACWGTNYGGTMGNGTLNNAYTPVAVTGINDAVALGVGAYHACAVHPTGGVSCWGQGNYGK